jgi:hypothetical protein
MFTRAEAEMVEYVHGMMRTLVAAPPLSDPPMTEITEATVIAWPDGAAVELEITFVLYGVTHIFPWRWTPSRESDPDELASITCVNFVEELMTDPRYGWARPDRGTPPAAR